MLQILSLTLPVKTMKLLFRLLFAVLLCCVSAEAYAARVDILPRKIIIEDRARSGDLTLLNMGEKPIVVRLQILSYRQKPDGTYETLKGPLNPAFNPDEVVRFSPRQFTLPAGGRQKVRLSIQKPANLPDGEYRFHVKASSFDEADFSVRRQQTRGSSIGIKTNVAVAIPVIVRQGNLTTGAKISNVSFVPPSQSGNNMPALKMDVSRTGTGGVLGTLIAFSDGGGTPREIGRISNLNVFSEVETRTAVMSLKEVPAGNIRIQYINDFGDKGVLDELVLQK